MNFLDELRWRGMLQDFTPGIEEILETNSVDGSSPAPPVKAYIGFDPTADSLGVGNLVQIMTLLHFQQAGHQPFALVGGATGMVGDPSGKSAERNLLDAETLQYNLESQKKQLMKFLDFNHPRNPAIMVNNYDWLKDVTFLEFIRDIGKHITVNYMMAKDSVQTRLEHGLSFTEFSYQLVQGYDFYYLWKNQGVQIQMGGSDQWGNIVTGTELVRRKDGGKAFALTTPLIKKADGTKFGKSEGGNIWLDPVRTSPYKFYQFWLNASDADAANYIRIFTLFDRAHIDALETGHAQAPHLRTLQKTLAQDITVRVHTQADFESAVKATDILFGGGSNQEALTSLSEEQLGVVAGEIPCFEISAADLTQGIPILALLSEKTTILSSKGEARRAIQGGAVAVNKMKITQAEATIQGDQLLHGKYMMVENGKKNKFMIRAI